VQLWPFDRGSRIGSQQGAETGRRERHLVRGMRVGLFLAVAAILTATVIVANTYTARSADHKAVEEPQISPMGAYARGDLPKPTPEEIGLFNQGPWPTAQAPMALQGNDVLVHSPTASDFQSETTIAKNGNYVVVGYNDVRGFSLPNISVSGYAYSSNSGVTWTDGGQLPTAGGSSAVYGDPDVKTWTDPNTQQVYFFYSSIYVTPAGLSSLCVCVSTDGGATWTAPREVTTATSATAFADKVFMDVDPETGRIFISWTNFGTSTTMRITYSDDKGLTWNGPTSFGSNVGQGSVPRAAGNSSNVYLTWRTTSTIQFCRSTNNGASWTGPTTIVSGLSNPMNPYGSDRIHGFPSMDVYDGNGYIYIVYGSRNLSPDFSDIYFTRSTTAGVSWSTPVAINSRPGLDRAQFFPWVSVDQSTGRIDAVWYDQMNGTGTSDITDMFQTYSEDLGVTWACPIPITDKPFHAEYGNTTSQPNIGDYNQCVSDGGSVYTSFAKTGEASYLTYAPDTYVDAHVATPAGAPLRFSSVAFTESGCTSGDGYIQAGETVDITVTIQQYSNCVGSVDSPSGVLTTSTPGVTVVQGLSDFGSLTGAGTTSTNTTPFTIAVSNSFPVPAYIDLLVTLSTAQGDALIPFRLETGDMQQTTLLSENFDGVTAPALPAGWSSTTFSGASNPWRTSTTYAASGPNAAFCADIVSISGNRLQSPSIVVPAATDLVDVTFDITHNLELNTERRAYDGALLRVEVNNGMTVQTKFAGAFASLFDPFYPWQVDRYNSSSDQPIQDLACWSSNTTPNFNSVHLQFPGLAGTTIRLFFDVGTDNGVGSATGMFVDNVVVKSIDRQSVCTDPPLLVAAPTQVDFTNVPVNVTTCDTVCVINGGPTDLTIAGFSGCTTSPFSLDTTMVDYSLAVGDSAKLVVCVTPTGPGPESCQIMVYSNASNNPVAIPVSLDVVTAIGDGTAPMPFRIVSVSPNPFNPSTTVRFTLPKAMPVTAEVWSVIGARVRVLADQKTFAAGENALRWDGRNDQGSPAASGVYFVRVKTQLGEKVTRAVLLK
jgi:hypothetical protein